MAIQTLEQLAAVLVTAGLVAGNFLLFTPWRDGHDPRDRVKPTPAKVQGNSRVSMKAEAPSQ